MDVCRQCSNTSPIPANVIIFLARPRVVVASVLRGLGDVLGLIRPRACPRYARPDQVNVIYFISTPFSYTTSVCFRVLVSAITVFPLNCVGPIGIIDCECGSGGYPSDLSHAFDHQPGRLSGVFTGFSSLCQSSAAQSAGFGASS
jgi:hypothetical protein